MAGISCNHKNRRRGYGLALTATTCKSAVGKAIKIASMRKWTEAIKEPTAIISLPLGCGRSTIKYSFVYYAHCITASITVWNVVLLTHRNHSHAHIHAMPVKCHRADHDQQDDAEASRKGELGTWQVSHCVTWMSLPIVGEVRQLISSRSTLRNFCGNVVKLITLSHPLAAYIIVNCCVNLVARFHRLLCTYFDCTLLRLIISFCLLGDRTWSLSWCIQSQIWLIMITFTAKLRQLFMFQLCQNIAWWVERKTAMKVHPKTFSSFDYRKVNKVNNSKHWRFS